MKSKQQIEQLVTEFKDLQKSIDFINIRTEGPKIITQLHDLRNVISVLEWVLQ